MSDYDPNYIPHKSFALVGQKAIILNPENQILLLQRSDKAGLKGKWSIPGGALEDGENPFEGIQREISEETKLKVNNVVPFHIKSYSEKNDFVVIIGYVCKANLEGVELNWEHSAYRWLTKEEALKLDLTSDAKTFIQQLKSF